MARKKKKSLLKNIVLLAASLAASLIVAELLIAFFVPQDLVKYKLDEDLVHRPRPDKVSEVITPEYHATSKTNSKGLHDYEYEYDFEGYTVVMLGDSFTEGLQVPIEKRFAKILETNLKEKKEDIRVVNCGAGNTGTDHQYLYLVKECSKYNPDLVMLNFYLGNDFANNYASLIFGYENGNLVDNRPIIFSALQRSLHFANTRFHSTKLLESIFLESDFLRNLLLKTGVYKSREALGYDLSLFDSIYLKEDNEITYIGYEKTFLLFDELIKYSNENNIKLIISLIPSREQVDTRKFSERFANPKDFDMLKPNKKLMNYFNEHDVDYIDLLPHLTVNNRNNSFYFEVDDHINEQGHELIGNVLSERLINLNLIS